MAAVDPPCNPMLEWFGCRARPGSAPGARLMGNRREHKVCVNTACRLAEESFCHAWIISGGVTPETQASIRRT